MENYCVRLIVSIDMNVKADNPNDAYNKAYNFTAKYLDTAFDNVEMSVIAGSVTDESGPRVEKAK